MIVTSEIGLPVTYVPVPDAESTADESESSGDSSGLLSLIQCTFGERRINFTIEFLPDAGTGWKVYDVAGDDPLQLAEVDGPIIWSANGGEGDFPQTEIAFAKTEADINGWWNNTPFTGPIVDFLKQPTGTFDEGTGLLVQNDVVFVHIPGVSPYNIADPIITGGVTSSMRNDLTTGYTVMGSDANFATPFIMWNYKVRV